MTPKMPVTDDYRKYLEEKFNSLNTTMKLNFDNIHERLDEIKEQTTKTNGRVTRLESDFITHPINCPNFKKIENIERNTEDLAFYMRHPKLFIAGMTIIILLTLATVIENNPFKIFSKNPPKTEMTK